MAAWAARRLDEIPTVESWDEPVWYPLQHHFGLTAFGVNLFVARKAGAELVGEHDETASGQEEIYLVLTGEAEFTIAAESVGAKAVTAVAVTDPGVRRAAVAREPGTSLLIIGGPRRNRFDSTWRAEHFKDVERL